MAELPKDDNFGMLGFIISQQKGDMKMTFMNLHKVLKNKLLLICCMTFLFVPLSIHAASYPITWNPASIEQTMGLGGTKDLALTFTSSTKLKNVDLRVVPELQQFVRVTPKHFDVVNAKTPYQVNFHINIPENTAIGLYRGTIQLKIQSQSYPLPLKVTVKVIPQSVSVASANIPASSGGIITVTESESAYSKGFSLEIPSGGLTRDTAITVSDVVANFPPVPDNMVPIGLPISLDPDGLIFNKPVTIKIPFSDEELLYAGVSTLDYLTLRYFNMETRQWEVTPIKAIDTANKYIIAEISHFSWWNPFSWFEPNKNQDPTTDEIILDYIQTSWKIVVSQDNIQVLSLPDPVSQIHFKSEIGGILTLTEMMQQMDHKDYAGAIRTGVTYLPKAAFKEAGYSWLGAYYALTLAGWDCFSWFINKVDEKTFNSQVSYYLEWRQWYSHEDIQNGCYEAYCRDDGGWLKSPRPGGVSPITSRFSPDQVLAIGKALWDAKQSDSSMPIDDMRIKENLLQAIQEQSAATSPLASFTIVPDTGNPPLNVTFDASSSQAKNGRSIVRYVWDFDDGITVEGVIVTHNYTLPRVYDVKLTVYDSANASGMTSKNVTVTPRSSTNQLPHADFAYQIDSTDPLLVSFSALPSFDPDGTIVQYRWAFGDGNIAYGLSSAYRYDLPGNYTVTLKVMDNSLTTSSLTKSLTVATVFSISGTVTLNGNGLSGVTLNLTGTATDSKTTDSSGNYNFTGLAAGDYTITPSMTGYTFTPPNIQVTVNNADVPGRDFAATEGNILTGLVAHWSFDNCDATDESGNGHNGSVVYYPQCIDGIKGKAFAFNGSAYYGSCMNFGNWFNYQDFSISMWVKPGSVQLWEAADIMDNNHNTDRSWVIQYLGYLNTGPYKYGFGVSPGYYLGDPTVRFDLIPNIWQHLIVVKSSNELKAYIDGVLVSSEVRDTSTVAYDGTQSLYLGCWGNGIQRFWSGVIDEVRIYNRGLSIEEINQLYSTALGAIRLPKTGQTKCYDTSGTEISCDGTGQDGDIKKGALWPTPRFTNPDGTMPIYGNEIVDRLTGLIWSRTADTPGPAACGPGTTKTWQGAIDHIACLNVNNYLGHSDWRLPNVKELRSLMHSGYSEQNCGGSVCLNLGDWLNIQGFINVSTSIWYWTSTTVAAVTGSAWFVDFWSNGLNYEVKSVGYYVLPVRGGQFEKPDPAYPSNLSRTGQSISFYGSDDGSLRRGVAWPNPRFTDNSNGTVTDNLTGLVWLKDANCTDTVFGVAKSPGSLTWTEALSWSNGLSSGNCSLSDGSAAGDWRLPNREELLSLVDFGYYSPALSNTSGIGQWSQGNPFNNVQDWYWSSTTTAFLFSSAERVDMQSGYVWGAGVGYGYKWYPYYVWPVRGGL